MGWIRWIPAMVMCVLPLSSLGASADGLRGVAVAPVEGNLPADEIAAIERSARGAVDAGGIEQPSPEQARAGHDQGHAPEDEPAYRDLGRRLGVRAVIGVYAMVAGEQVTLMLRGIPTAEAVEPITLTANAARGGVTARVRVLTTRLLRELEQRLPPPTGAPARPGPPSPEVAGPTQPTRRAEPPQASRCRLLDRRCSGRRSMRQLGVFGIGMAVHGGSTYLAAMIMMLAEASDTGLIVGGAFTLGVTPFISAAAAKGIGGRRCYAVDYGPLLAGSMSGAALAYGAGLAYVLSGSDNGFWMATSLFVLPGLLPAVGVAIAYSAARERRPCAGAPAKRGRSRRRSRKWRGWRWARAGVALEPPSPTTIVAWDGSGAMAPGISLGRLRF